MVYKRVTVLDHPFDTYNQRKCLSAIEKLARKNKVSTIAFANTEHIIHWLQYPVLQEYISDCDIILPDGIGVIWASKLLKHENNNQTLDERITGTDTILKIAQLCENNNWKLFLYGGSKSNNTSAQNTLKKQFPQLKIEGIDGFTPTTDKVLQAIRAFEPTFVMVCLGNPKQEEWIHRHRHILPPAVYFGNGGAIDFLAGVVKRAPLWLQRSGLEWIWRFFQDISWKRLLRLFTIPYFLWLVLVRKIYTNN